MTIVTQEQVDDAVKKLQDSNIPLAEYALLYLDPGVMWLFGGKKYGKDWQNLFRQGIYSRVDKMSMEELINTTLGGELNPFFDGSVGANWQKYFREKMLERMAEIETKIENENEEYRMVQTMLDRSESELRASKQSAATMGIELITQILKERNSEALVIASKALAATFGKATAQKIIAEAKSTYARSLKTGDTRDIK